MSALARRSILRLFGGVAVAAPRAAAYAAEAVSTGSSLGGGLLGMSQSSDAVGSGIGGYAVSSDPIMWAAQKAFVHADRRFDRKRERMIGGLDPDLAVLGSTSPAWRALRQQERNRRELSTLGKLRRVVFKNDDHASSIYEVFGQD